MAGAAAFGTLETYLFQRYDTKKQRFNEDESAEAYRTGYACGAHIEDIDDPEQKRAVTKPSYEMDDIHDETEDEN